MRAENGGFCTKSDRFYTEHDGLYTIHDGSHTEHDGFYRYVVLTFGDDQKNFKLQFQTDEGKEICAKMRAFATGTYHFI